MGDEITHSCVVGKHFFSIIIGSAIEDGNCFELLIQMGLPLVFQFERVDGILESRWKRA